VDDRLGTIRPLVVPEIIALPPEIDITNADGVGTELRTAFRPGVAVVIADMTQTTFCDSAAARNLLLANDKASESHAELRLAIPSAAVLRTLKILGLDQVLRIYPSLEAALTSGRSERREDRQARGRDTSGC
jgi:anti-anti-sigma factor